MIRYEEIDVNKLEEYGNIPFGYTTNKKYEIKRIDNGKGGIKLELVDVPTFTKDFGNNVSHWKELFDMSNWKFFVAYDEDKMIGGSIVATKTKNCNMLEGRDDLAVLWDIRVSEEYKGMGIGTKLFCMAKEYAKSNGFRELKIECQNTNPAAVNFYYKQGAMLGAINMYAYKDYPDEVQLLLYLDL